MSASGSVPAGTRVGRYDIVSLLRQGGMGEVYEARDRNLDRAVALKILPPHRTSDPERVARFVREAKASSTLNHPAIVAVFDAGSEGGVHFLAMELIDGEPLSAWMRKRRSVSSRVEVMAQVAEGLARAHDAGIVHRDLKPDNIMVTRDCRAKIVDFGVAKLTERGEGRGGLSGVTTPTSRVGTTAYMSPEQIEGRPVDHRTDVFAFGAVLHELLTGANPFAAPRYADTIHNVVHLEPSLHGIPRPLQRIVRRCLQKEPGHRYDSLRDAALDLRESGHELASAPISRRRLVVPVLVLLVAVALILWTALSSTKSETGRASVAASPNMTMTRLTHSGRVTTAAISPDGRYLIHAVKEGDQQALYLRQIATGTSTLVAGAAPVYYFNLRVSPDGNYAYYVAAQRSEPNVASIYQLPFLGGAPRRIAEDTEYSYSISPDGNSVVFIRFNAFDREHRVTIAAVDGSGERVVLRRRPPEFAGNAIWAPDGQSITFVGGNAMQKDSKGLYRLTLASGEVTKMPTPDFEGVGSYAWLPDGSGALVTAHERHQPPQIWFVPKDSTVGRKVTSEVSAYFGVTPTADSHSMSAVREVMDSNIYTIDLANRGAEHAVTTGLGNWVGGGGVQWQGEREVLFSSYTDGMGTFFAVGADGGTPRRLIQNLPMWGAVVSPDRSRIAFVSNKSGSSQIWVADASGANARQVTSGPSVTAPSFTPDGRSLVYGSVGEMQYAWKTPIDGGGSPVQLTDVPTNRPIVSPDGKWLLCRLRSREPDTPLWRTAAVRLDGSRAIRYFDIPRLGGPPLMDWYPDSAAFVFVDYHDGVANLWKQDLAGGEPRQLTFFESGEIYSFDVAGDGRRVVLARGQETRDAVLITNFR